MTQTHDLMIDGAGYMIVPGSYRYESKGADISPVRTGVPAFDQRLGHQATLPSAADRDAVRWQAVGMLPVPSGLGDGLGRLMLAPGEVSAAGGSVAFDANARGIVYNGTLFVSCGNLLYLAGTAGANYTGLTFIGTAPGVITGMCVTGGLLFLACGGAATTMANYAYGGAFVSTSPAATAQVIWDYARGLWRSKKNAATAEWSVASGSFDGGATWTDFQLDSAIRSACVWHGRATGGGTCLVATHGMLWELAGQWTGSPAVFSGTVSQLLDGRGGGGADDFAWLVEYEGAIYTWYAGTVYRFTGTRLEPLPGAPRGTTYQAAVAGGYLCVAVRDPATATTAVWVFDGVRWMLLARSGTAYGNLYGAGGAILDGHLFSLNLGSTSARWQLPVVGLPGTPQASGQVIAGPLDAGAADAIKTWTQISVPWSTILYPAGTSAPANPGGNLLAEYSVDDGVTYVSLGNVVVAAAARSGLAQWTVSSGGAEANRLLVRITWTPTSAYAGLQIDAVFASGWRIADKPKDERWTAAIKVSDRLIRRDGAVDPRSGETMLQALRALAQAGRTFAFQDLDYDLSSRSVTCRVVDLTESTRKGDGTRFLETTVTLTLAAVA